MADEKKNKCAHPACNCKCEPGSKYCSQYCKDAGNTTETSCNCRHPGCLMTEPQPATLALSESC